MNEHIGRRLFDEPALRGAGNQPAYAGIRLNHFEDDEPSLDRLGASGVEKKVINYLRPRALAQQERKGGKSFDGWATVCAREFLAARDGQIFDVHASPIQAPDPDENLFHAHMARPENMDRKFWALLTRNVFASYGKPLAHLPEQGEPESAEKTKDSAEPATTEPAKDPSLERVDMVPAPEPQPTAASEGPIQKWLRIVRDKLRF